jgi:hypothetical protein
MLIVLNIVALMNGVSKENYSLQTKALWENSKKVEIQSIIKIGADDLDKADYLFGFISDIYIDQDDNVYILDLRNGRARQYAPDGKYIKSYGKGIGQGPGEFIQAAQIGVDFLGNVYIGDKSTRKISVFDAKGVFKTAFLLNKVAPTSCLLLDRMMRLFVGVDQRYISSGGWEKGIYQIYASNGDFIDNLGSPMDKKDASISIGGNSICFDERNGNIVISYALPYKVEIYSRELKMLHIFGRKCSYFFDNIKRDDIIYSCGSSYRVAMLADGNIVNMIRCIRTNKDKDEILNYFDIFDDKGNYLMSIPGDRFSENGKESRGMKSDKKGHLYLVYENPYPHIEKYRVTFVNKE